MNTARRTPYDDAYGTCERTDATLRIYSADLAPTIVTERLELEPTSSQYIGQTFTNSLGRTRTASLNAWFLSSEGAVSSLDLRRHLDWILERFMPVRDAVLRLQEHPDLTMDVSCVWWSARGQGGPTLWPEQMRALADLNLECSFEIGFYGDDED